jgi:tRNA pseudouridine32 synthase/23S rRNA pseudouridine746 synthase
MQIIEGEPENSCTMIGVLEVQNDWAKYELKPITGKQHQLRVHMNALGLPLKNDQFYPTVKHVDKAVFSQPLQLLAKSICFVDPISNKPMSFHTKRQLTF